MIWTIIQARLGSERLPRKVLGDIGGHSMLEHVCARAVHLGAPFAVSVPDPELAVYCANHRWICFLGSEHDVLDRYVQAARALEADHVVRVTADCPFLDVEAGKWTIQEHLDFGADLTAYEAEGRGVEVFTRAALERSAAEAEGAFYREHPDEWILQHPNDFRTRYVKFSVDTQEELELARRRVSG